MKPCARCFRLVEDNQLLCSDCDKPDLQMTPKTELEKAIENVTNVLVANPSALQNIPHSIEILCDAAKQHLLDQKRIEELEKSKEHINSMCGEYKNQLRIHDKAALEIRDERDSLKQKLAEVEKWKNEDPRMLREQLRVADSAYQALHERHQRLLATINAL
jgi:chromosome segregation ATPase